MKKTVVIDACSFLKKYLGECIINKAKQEKITVALCRRLSDEYERHIGEEGLSPLSVMRKLDRLKEQGQLIMKRDEELVRILPEEIDDSHLVNLAKTINADIVITSDKKARKLLKKYEVKVMSQLEFLFKKKITKTYEENKSD